MSLSNKQIAILLASIVLLIGLSFILVINRKDKDVPDPVSLTVWGFERKDVMEAALSEYKDKYPHVTAVYTEIPSSDYEKRVVDALASGSGPDVFLINAGYLDSFKNKIWAFPKASYPLSQLDSDFPRVVSENLVRDGLVFGIPYSVDTLALLYNKTYLDQASFVSPPSTWEDFQSYVSYLKIRNTSGQIERAGAAMGGGSAIKNSPDILYLLLQQNGAIGLSDGKPSMAFDKANQAVGYYMQFGDTGSPSFTWSDDLGDSISQIADGKVAMGFGYYSDYLKIKGKSPFVPIGITMVPQVSQGGAVNVASYSAMVVSKQSRKAQVAQNFILSFIYDAAVAKKFVEFGYPPALKSVIGQYVNDPELRVFSRQALTARSPLPVDKRVIEEEFLSLINDVRFGRSGASKAMQTAWSGIVRNLPK